MTFISGLTAGVGGGWASKVRWKKQRRKHEGEERFDICFCNTSALKHLKAKSRRTPVVFPYSITLLLLYNNI